MSIVIKNIFSNYIGKIWSFISIYLFIPQYVKLLGVESYGIINFYTVLLSIMLIADSGLSASLNREMARSNDLVYNRNLLKTIEVVYLGISFFIFIVVFCLNRVIVNYWLNIGNGMNIDNLYFCIKLMGGSIGLQMLFIMYNSGLMGLQKQVLANNIQISMSIVKSGLVLIPLYFFPKIEVYFIWQLITTFIFMLIIRYSLWKAIRFDVKAVFNLKLFKNIYKFALGMLLMALVAGLNTQIDKLFVSKLLSIKDFGYYSLAGVFGQAATILVLPLAVAILPKMTKFADKTDIESQKEIFHKYSFIISTVVAIVTGILVVFAESFILMWTKDLATTTKIVGIARVLLVGGGFLALQYMPYHLAIAHGHTKTNLMLGISVVCLMSPMLYFSIQQFGLIGATYPWFIINAFAFFYLGYYILKKYLPNEFNSWLWRDTVIPIFISIFILLAFKFFFPSYKNWSTLNSIVTSGLLSVFILSINGTIFYKKYVNNKNE
ncbi:oligosaccharide flippase family protein [Elizabethkingia anophelis]|uniref:oligosaccharide flippase family protein n=1 Tax=Elizabethkingia anophelis TaxID=1117645 RepID=UPI003556B523